jgi:LPXTG-motif cell wall-anchored protein
LLALTTLFALLAPTAALAAGGTTTTAPKRAHGAARVKTAPATLSPTAPASIVTNPHPSQSLPLTGVNVEAIAFIGLLLVAGGLTLRWRVARR